MILAAGFGTRLLPVTEKIPKALVEVDGKPMLQLVLQKLITAGFSNFIINTHHFSELVQQFISGNHFNADIKLVSEEKILGTGGGIKNAEKYLKSSGNFLVHNVDVITDFDIDALYRAHTENKAIATLAVQKRKTSRPLLFSAGLRLSGRIVEGEAETFGAEGKLTEMAFAGVHVLSTEIFNSFPSENEFDIIPVYMSLAASSRRIYGFDIVDSQWKDAGKSANK